jgi:hypothetical protein
VEVKYYKESKGVEEAEVILTGKYLNRVMAAEVRGAQVRILKKTPTVLHLKLTGKGAALRQAAAVVRLRAGAELKEVSVGRELARARQLAAKPAIDKWREDIGKGDVTKGAGRTLEMERARDTARPTDDDLPHLERETPLSETAKQTINSRDKDRGLSAGSLPANKKLQAKNFVNPLSSAYVTTGNPCAGKSVIRIRGGPFESGTDTYHHSLRGRWRNGMTSVEVACDSGDDCAGFFNSLIYSVKILPDPSELEVEIGRCFVIQKNPLIRVIYPNGIKSNWVNVSLR